MASTENSSVSEGQMHKMWKGKSWLEFYENIRISDSNEEYVEPETKNESHPSRLNEEDMRLFGQCPENDKFYLVVCQQCGYIVKPQRLEYHIENKHGKATLQNSQPELNSMYATVTSSIKTNSVPSFRTTISNKTNNSTSNKSKSSTIRHYAKNSNNNQDNSQDMDYLDFSASPIENHISQLLNSDHLRPPQSSNSDHLKSLQSLNSDGRLIPVEYLTSNMNNTSTTVMPSVQQHPQQPSIIFIRNANILSSTSGPGPGINFTSSNLIPNRMPLTKATKPRRSQCRDREYDSSKHCGVRLENGKQCTYSLASCKIHSATLRRNVKGRPKTFNELIAERKAAKEALNNSNKVAKSDTNSLLLEIPQSQEQMSETSNLSSQESLTVCNSLCSSPLTVVTNLSEHDANSPENCPLETPQQTNLSNEIFNSEPSILEVQNIPISRDQSPIPLTIVTATVTTNVTTTVTTTIPSLSTTEASERKPYKHKEKPKVGESINGNVHNSPFILHHPRPSAFGGTFLQEKYYTHTIEPIPVWVLTHGEIMENR